MALSIVSLVWVWVSVCLWGFLLLFCARCVAQTVVSMGLKLPYVYDWFRHNSIGLAEKEKKCYNIVCGAQKSHRQSVHQSPSLYPSLHPSQSLHHNVSITFLHREHVEHEDKLTPDEIEQLVQEILKSFMDDEKTRDPYMSPSLAPEELLVGMPPIHLIVRTYMMDFSYSIGFLGDIGSRACPWAMVYICCKM